MAKAKKVTQLELELNDEVGLLGKVSEPIASSGINIEAICAYSEEGKAHFMIVTTNNDKAQEILNSKGISSTKNEVVSVLLENKVGAAKEFSESLANSGINLTYCYGTVGNTDVATLILNSDNNDRLIEAINQ